MTTMVAPSQAPRCSSRGTSSSPRQVGLGQPSQGRRLGKHQRLGDLGAADLDEGDAAAPGVEHLQHRLAVGPGGAESEAEVDGLAEDVLEVAAQRAGALARP